MNRYPLLMRPVSKQIMWGGDLLKREYNKTAPFDKIAESWELTVREDEVCVIANGEYTGMTMDKLIAEHKSVLGTNCAKYDRFPLLIKFIDAADRLSIQVHPDNEYSLANEGELGKTEMWYIMDCEPGAKLVYGLKDGCTIADFAQAVEEGRTEDMMNYVDVKPGDVYFIPAGQVHAIGAGILIAEIQQNSNITYRVFDYNRRQADGSLRELHTKKAIDVIKLRSTAEIDEIRYSNGDTEACTELLCACEYFTSRKYSTDSENVAVLHVDDKSFVSLLVLDADGAEIEMGDTITAIHKGESYFIPAGSGEVKISGKAETIATLVN